MYMPPYRPDFNPLEIIYSFVKSYLEKHESTAMSDTTPLVKDISLHFT